MHLSSESIKKKIALGTVQLGLSYGINNQVGKPSDFEAFAILDEAINQGIVVLDSAEAYGNSLEVIGRFLRQRPHASFKVVSKFIAGLGDITKNLKLSLKTLGVPALHGYMFHRFEDYRSAQYKDEMHTLKSEGVIKNIGVSLYSNEELEQVLADPDITIVQVPLNPFDSSNKKLELLSLARKYGKEVHVRSIYLQGLFFKEPDSLTGNLMAFKSPLKEFHQIVQRFNLDVLTACLNMAIHLNCVDHVVIGVETSDQLVQNSAAIHTEFPAEIIEAFQSIVIPERLLLNPTNWKP